jgi:hypothetical protein
MLIEGSCSCGAVGFSLESQHPVPYQRCYCSICRKTAGGGGYCINISGDANTLKVKGEDYVRIYRASITQNGEVAFSRHQRHFCGQCGSHLWAFHESWPELVHPVAGAIDTELPPPSENVHLMIGSKASWTTVEGRRDDAQYPEYPEQSITDFHDQRGWTVD